MKLPLFLLTALSALSPALAQEAAPAADAAQNAPQTFGEWWSHVWSTFISDGTLSILKNLGIAVAILFGGWILARVLTYLLYVVLCKTDVDNKIAKAMHIDLLLQGKKPRENAVEHFLSRIFFYILMLIVVIVALNAVGLDVAAGPISNFVDTVVQALPLIGKAVLILAISYFAAVILRKLTTAALSRVDDRFAEVGGENARPFSQSAGTLVFWLILLIGLAGAFEALKIDAIAGPMQDVLKTALQLLPKVGVAALILLGGYILGLLARKIISNLLAAIGFNGLPAKIKIDRIFVKRTASDVVGLIVMVFIMLHALIAALDALTLKQLSDPISNIIDQFWALLPSLVLAFVILTVGVILGKLARSLISSVLSSIGLDRWLARLGLNFERMPWNDENVCAENNGEAAVTDGAKAEAASKRIDKPSELLGFIAQIAIVLLATVQVLDTLKLAVWSNIVQTFLSYTFLRLLIALVIVAIGLAIGNYVRDLVVAKGAPDDAARRWIGGGLRIAILVFACTMGLQQLDVAPTFVLLTFGLVFGALCLALALAFGLGARETAAEVVKQQYSKARDKGHKGFFSRS